VKTRIPPRYQKIINEGRVSERDMRIAIEEAKMAGRPIARMLVELTLLKESKEYQGHRKHDKQSIDLTDRVIDEDILEMVPQHKAEKLEILPYSIEDGKVIIAASDPDSITANDWLSENLSLPFELVFNKTGDIIDHISKNYLSSKKFEKMIRQIDWMSDDNIIQNEVQKVVKHMILYGIRKRATDIHVNPEEHCLRIKYRIDGDFNDFIALPKNSQSRVTTVLKLMAAPEVKAEVFQTPQDGSFRISFGSTEMDIRLSVIPELDGENIVLRIQNPNALRPDLGDLGMPPHIIEHFKQVIKAQQGIVLVTGRTGAGKTTTLYSAMMNIDQIGKNILTLEDPIELPIRNVRQFQVNPEHGISFSEGVRAFLRQDPDIIMVGEMRDKETIDMAMRAANTGHLVLSTLHTTSATQTITRLLDMGVEPFVIASALKAVLAQRLIKKLCQCKKKITLDANNVKLIVGEENFKSFEDVIDENGQIELWEAGGCSKCEGSGHYGRIGVYEFIKINKDLAKFINQPRDVISINEWVKENMPWFTTISNDAMEKVKMGIISLTDAAAELDEE